MGLPQMEYILGKPSHVRKHVILVCLENMGQQISQSPFSDNMQLLEMQVELASYRTTQSHQG